jgi:hypothetical protein
MSKSQINLYSSNVGEPTTSARSRECIPVRTDRKRGAALITLLYFPISPRTLERPVTWVRVNGKATTTTAELFAEAEARLAGAPRICGGLGPISGKNVERAGARLTINSETAAI